VCRMYSIAKEKKEQKKEEKQELKDRIKQMDKDGGVRN